MNWLLNEHDSEIIEKDKAKKFFVTVVFSGDYEIDLDADMWIEHNQSGSYEEWEIKGQFTVDDAFKLGSKVGLKPTVTDKSGSFSALLSANGKKGEQLYLAAEKYFGIRKISKTRHSKVKL